MAIGNWQLANGNIKTTGHKLLAISPCARRGFTLIEILVVITLFAVVGAISADLLISVTRSSNKANIITELERNGNIALTTMTTEIRNARSIIYPPPPTGGTTSTLEIGGQDKARVTFSREAPSGENGYVARNDNPITDTARTSGSNVTALSFRVIYPGGAPAVVTITLGLSQPVGAPGRIDYQASTTLTTTVSLRTYSD